MRARSVRYFLISIVCGMGIVGVDIWYAYAISPNALPDAVKKKVGIGKTVSISGWAWNGATGWVSQRGAITEGGGAYGITKNATEGVTGWSWSSNYGWICWGETCEDNALNNTSLYGGKKPRVGSNAQETNPDVIIEAVQTFPVFGDSKVEGTEQCDHGSANGASDDSCGTDGKGRSPVAPATAACGNGIKESGETCDDGDGDDTNACMNACSGSRSDASNLCGNGSIDSGEECDDGDRVNTNACKNDCTKNGRTVEQERYDFHVRGWIKAIGLKDDGWISLRGKVQCNDCVDKDKEYGVIYDPDHKEFRGWAWSPAFGWMVFSGRTLYDTEYRYAKVTPFGGEAGSEKYYDVTEYAAGSFRILIPPKNGYEREYLLGKEGDTYQIKSASEFKRNADGTIDNSSIRQIGSDAWDDVEVFDATACQGGCDASYTAATKKSTWKTQLLSPWVQTAGGNVFSRKGFGGGAIAFRPSSEYLLYSGGVTLKDDLRVGEKMELSCCSADVVTVTKIGLPHTVNNPSYASELDGENEMQIFKQQGKVKKRSGSGVSDASSGISSVFSGLLEGEGRRLKKRGGDVEVRIVYPLYASIAQADTDMEENDEVSVIKNSSGALKKSNGSSLSSALERAFSSEKRIVGALTSWTSECDDPTKVCSSVGRKSGEDIIKADPLKRDGRPDVAFPQRMLSQNIRRNTLGSLDIDTLIAPPKAAQKKNTHGYAVVSIQDEEDISKAMADGLQSVIFVKDDGKDLSIGSSDDRALFGGANGFHNGTSGKSGSGTIIVNGGNLHIYRPLQYEGATVGNIKNLASVAWIVLEKDGKGGNIIFDDCITPVSMTMRANGVSITQPVAPAAGIFFAEGVISTGSGDGSACSFSDGNDIPLYIDGMLIARKINLLRVYGGDPDLNIASEYIQDTGRAVVNTPPGLQDILMSLPAW